MDESMMGEWLWLQCFMAGVSAMENGDAANAVRELEGAVKHATDLQFREQVVRTLLALGDAHRMLGQLAEAKSAFQQAVDHSSRLTELRVPYAFSLGAIGKLYLEQDLPAEALPYLQKCVDVLRRNRAVADPEFFMLFAALIICYMELNEFDKAEKLSKYALDFANEVIGPDDLAVVMALHYCALCADAIGKPRRGQILRTRIRMHMDRVDQHGASDALGVGESLKEIGGPLHQKMVVFEFEDGAESSIALRSPGLYL